MEVVQVQPRDSYLHYVHVPAKGMTIRWSFTTKRKNIAFGLFQRLGTTRLQSSSDIVFPQWQQQRQLSLPNVDGQDPSDDDKPSADTLSVASRRRRPRAKSTASNKLRGQDDFVEIIPIDHCNSADVKVEGSYVVRQPGNFVLVFDNTFSKTTPKSLTFSVTVVGTKDESQNQRKDISGWILKKRRKKLQGWAKRWLQLSSTGVLSYSTTPNSITRGSIQIVMATVSLNPQQRLIHIDSGTMLYHLKALSVDDYEMWTKALRDFRNEGQQTQQPETFITPERAWSEVEQGVRGSTALTTNLSQYVRNADIMKDLLYEVSKRSGLEDIQEKLAELTLQLNKDKESVMEAAEDQRKQWHTVQDMLHSVLQGEPVSRPSGVTFADDLQARHNITRERPVSVRASVFSEQFFDAQEILLSGDEDDDEDYCGSVSDKTKIRESLDLTRLGECNQRRKCLPSPSAADPAYLSIFRKNVGKDLSQITMPISMNEPINLLQKACEELEYSELLDKAASSATSMERLMYVAVFAISGYASSQFRIGRKPFNPLMTETYENIRPDKGFRFVAEKVSHRPLMIAAHAESRNYSLWQCTKIKSKFWGKSMEFMTEGTYHITLAGHNDHYTYTKPSSWARNMIAGEKYVEHVGEMKVINHSTGEYGIVTFKEGKGGGLFSAPTKRNELVATFHDANGTLHKRVVGTWSEGVTEEVDLNSEKLSILWRVQPPGIDNYQQYYGFTKFCVELNEITPIEEGKIPKTDTRLRPDQRLYENGKVEVAEEMKQQLEQKQRDRRRELEEAGIEWKPRWFTLKQDEYASLSVNHEDDNSGYTWQYNGQYWPTRESGNWPEDIFDLW
ncbi:hypothetical protein EC973_008989 [Apophysomyces ossiformis]|uniref:Oxysterol-binding protein n=1 Tax=Apophysomyces ossiformis TaxID=679940 RepID=A0A8H7BSL7_9FUNG|nr:hypothetical protein EC973_008989 [Apophysomyces ossiformis]